MLRVFVGLQFKRQLFGSHKKYIHYNKKSFNGLVFFFKPVRRKLEFFPMSNGVVLIVFLND